MEQTDMIKVHLIVERQEQPTELDDCPDVTVEDQSADEVSFKELVQLMCKFKYVSCSPAVGATYEWLSTEPECDYVTGDYITESLHFDRANEARKAKYWQKAMQLAGLAR
ncbi:MAG: hypothetical protein EB120_13640 [Proteobacteria bacterium]|nr:hypothetical protein [Pseudomonadota bacterium]